MHHLTDEESTVLTDAERGALMAARSHRHPAERCWISTQRTGALPPFEHDPHTVACLLREGMLQTTPAVSLVITDLGRDALQRYRFERRPVEVAA